MSKYDNEARLVLDQIESAQNSEQADDCTDVCCAIIRKALDKKEERMMRFSDWIWRKERNRDRYGFPIAENIQEAFQYFLDNVEPSESQLKEESNPNRKYL